ncbi:LPS export ABC transporter permease LptG [Tianweitania sediminis]|jgi:lipopolysaccharide export system permease protein|uniref:LPS export ABC transporter permease LptG n=1 Tax=Tianweitania sediminis TaxID=1502156 RepID=A0A8J7QYF4_9HYPH|nr:LPS export ABC transporter permease LptG [Tianweitania sediminis]MBP0439013.1 LPS export ABC transporter permease LptG [Tianweitania sediminis]HEV7416941.1 LPS export ABC transporter permease LptG [Tianweitania sediminis]
MIGFTLGRYFFLRYVTITAWFFLGVFALVFIVDFTEFQNVVAGLSTYSFTGALTVSALRVPMVMQQTVPFIGLFSAMATLVSLNRKYELVIARSAGISAWQFLTPIALGAFVFGLFTIVVLNPIAAAGFERSQGLETNLRAGEPNRNTAFETPWLRQSFDGVDTIISAQAVLNNGLELREATFFRFDSDGDFSDRLDVQQAFLRDGYWELQGIESFANGARIINEETVHIPTGLTPDLVQERVTLPETIPFFELPGRINTARAFGLSANAFAMQFQSLLALPILLVAMTLIAATVSMRFTRMGQNEVMILGGILAGFLLYVVSVLVRAFGSAGIVPPVIAAWVPVVVAMFFGVTFLLHREDG